MDGYRSLKPYDGRKLGAISDDEKNSEEVPRTETKTKIMDEKTLSKYSRIHKQAVQFV
jgi:hypothetical protein